jgi:hypothetical protein
VGKIPGSGLALVEMAHINYWEKYEERSEEGGRRRSKEASGGGRGRWGEKKGSRGIGRGEGSRRGEELERQKKRTLSCLTRMQTARTAEVNSQVLDIVGCFCTERVMSRFRTNEGTEKTESKRKRRRKRGRERVGRCADKPGGRSIP